MCKSFVPRTCNSYYLAAALNYTKEKKKREKGKGKEVLKATSKKKEGKEEKLKNCIASFESLV